MLGNLCQMHLNGKQIACRAIAVVYAVLIGGYLIPIAVATPAAGCVGDYNSDGVCTDAADYVVWRNNLGTSNILPNDPIGGTIGAAQYTQWKVHFGESSFGSGSNLISSSGGVPEPASWMLAATALALFGIRRSRR